MSSTCTRPSSAWPPESFDKNKALDGLDVWSTIAEGAPSPRTEVIYNLEPFRAGVRQGDWKLIWRTPLPAAVELYNIEEDPSEKNDVAAANPEKVAALQRRANELAATMAKSLFLTTEFNAVRQRLSLPPALPKEEMMFDEDE
jgi:arylsulfatase A-like enzyme